MTRPVPAIKPSGCKVLGFLFAGDSPPSCLAAANSNGDPALDITDGIFILSFLFLGLSEPPPPFPRCGQAATGELECAGFAPCRE